ncbi:MAG: radical SAM family heme chaperone HemW [Clostridia bacterium]|nr:radical SAM family heme chaperone HemW [Clostridia bacterium]
MTNKLSLYFHIPFCVKKCDYCAFYSLANQNDELIDSYFQALCRQVSSLQTQSVIKTVYFGGGTPPLLAIPRLIALLDLIRTRFKLAPDCEITIEINPKTVDYHALSALRAAGFNRLSVGIQSANDSVLQSLGRIHTFADAVECFDSARRAGFKNVSADIILALPYRPHGTLVSELNAILSLNPDHISAYSLQLEEGTPLYKRRESLILPDEDDEEEEYRVLCNTLSQRGYKHYEVSSFAREGFESRHNSIYWECGEYFGFGAGAHSYYLGKRFSAKPDVNSFIEKSHLSPFAPTDFDSSPILTDTEREEEAIMLGLRTAKGAVIPENKKHIGIKVHSLGYGDYDPRTRRLALNSRGFRVSNAIIADILG